MLDCDKWNGVKAGKGHRVWRVILDEAFWAKVASVKEHEM